MFGEASEGPGGPQAVETDSAIQRFLKGALSPQDQERLQALLSAIEQQGEAPRDEDGNPADGVVAPEDIRAFLETRLAPEAMRYLESLIAEIDHGPDADNRAQATQKLKDAVRRQQETNMNTMTAQDEALDLRRRLRANGVPVGQYGDADVLRRVWRSHGGGRALAMDSGRLPASLSFDRLYPGLRSRLEGRGILAVAAGGVAREGRSVADRIALDSLSANAISFDAMYGDLRRRIKVG